MQDFTVRGRHLDRPSRLKSDNITVEVQNYPGESITLRLDDKENLDWWLEIDIPLEKLVLMANKCRYVIEEN